LFKDPIHLTLDTTLVSGRVTMKAYVFVPLGVPGATSGSMFTPVPVEVRLRMFLARVLGDPDRTRIQSGQWIRIRIRKMKAYVFVPLGVPGATSGSMFIVHPCSRRVKANNQFYLIADPEPGSQTQCGLGSWSAFKVT
jgi:hypothetical protein